MADKLISLSDFCVARIGDCSCCESCGKTTLPTIIFDYSEFFTDEFKFGTKNANTIWCYACFSGSGFYDENVSLMSDDKIKELIITYCNENIEFGYKEEKYKSIIKECNNIKKREELLELFKTIGWDSTTFF